VIKAAPISVEQQLHGKTKAILLAAAAVVDRVEVFVDKGTSSIRYRFFVLVTKEALKRVFFVIIIVIIHAVEIIVVIIIIVFAALLELGTIAIEAVPLDLANECVEVATGILSS